MRYTTNLALFLASTFLIVLPARADLVPPPEAAPCMTKQPGDTCTYTSAPGVCGMGTCSKLDYDNWDPDALSSPPMETYPCLQCVTGTATATGTSTDTGSQTDTGTRDEDPPAGDDGACSIGGRITAKGVAPWLLAVSFSLLFLFARRRRH